LQWLRSLIKTAVTIPVNGFRTGHWNYINGTGTVGDNCTAQGGSCIGNNSYQELFVSGLFLYWEQIVLVHLYQEQFMLETK
jgi:hypothetical protein